ncbi:hypothetical protein [Streptomyces fagopyri]|uniref:hypothetical protein n=1 Tax=Streptomyces fagopyri TaxID=2662397 RepID=UPI003403A8F4
MGRGRGGSAAALHRLPADLKVDPDTVELEERFSRDMHGIGHLGTGNLEVRITSAADFEKASPLIRRAFEAA